MHLRNVWRAAGVKSIFESASASAMRPNGALCRAERIMRVRKGFDDVKDCKGSRE